MKYGFTEFVNGAAILLGIISVVLGVTVSAVTIQEDWILALGSGGSLIMLGIGVIVFAQLSNAMIDTARASRKSSELLAQLLSSSRHDVFSVDRQAASPSTDVSASHPVRSKGQDTVYVKSYKGYRIEKIDGTRIFLVDGKDFEGLMAAEQYVSRLAGKP